MTKIGARLVVPQSTFLVVVALSLALSSAPATARTGSAPWVGETFAGGPCRGGAQGYGPYDYTKKHLYREPLRLVEGAHFTSDVESLRKGKRKGVRDPLPDLDYTLRAWPNHHRALHSAIRFHIRKKGNYRHPIFAPTECYLQRAVNFSPDDGTARMLWGMLLHRTGRRAQALPEYEAAETLSPTNPEIKYNLGLLLAEQGEFARAKKYADILYKEVNWPLPGLMKRLQAAGYWEENTPH